jgi:hypothetical protein
MLDTLIDVPEAPPEEQPDNPQVPHSREAEEAVLGAVLIDPAVYDDLNKFLQPNDFYIHRLRWVWESYTRLNEAHTPIDYLTVSEDLERHGKLNEIGGAAYLTALLDQVPTTLNAEAYGRIIAEDSARRREIARLQAETNENGKKIARLYDKSIAFENPKAPKAKMEWSVEDLLDTVFPDPSGPIPGIFPIGEVLVGGRPKRGKSTLMRQFVVSAGQGGRFLNREVEIRKTLYYALEDSEQRLQKNLLLLGADRSSLAKFRRTITPLHLGGISEIEKAIVEERFSVIVVDTLWKAMPGRDTSKDGALFSDVLGKVQEIALREAATVAFVVQNRKPNGFDFFDPVDDVCGHTGLTVAADCVMGLYTEKGKPGARLIGIGRDFEPFDWKIHLDHDTLCWQLDGETDAVKMSAEREEIIAFLVDEGKSQKAKIAKSLNMDYSNCSKKINALWTEGFIRREEIDGHDYFYVPSKEK